MNTDLNSSLNFQRLTVSNDSWTIELCFEDEYAESKVVDSKDFSKVINLSEGGYSGSCLGILATNKLNETRSCLITGINGGGYLHTAVDKDKSQTVKLAGDHLILSSGNSFLTFNIEKQEIVWSIEPDQSGVFGFYDLDNDFLLRGEMEIHRIDSNGIVKWSYGGRDIWVNIDGKEEVIIEKDKIKLTDFVGNIYIIDFNGKTLWDKPFVESKALKKWWEIWK